MKSIAIIILYDGKLSPQRWSELYPVVVKATTRRKLAVNIRLEGGEIMASRMYTLHQLAKLSEAGIDVVCGLPGLI